MNLIDGRSNTITIHQSCLPGYTDGDILKVKISKKNCIDRVFEAQTKLICGCRVTAEICITNCIQQTGKHDVYVFDQSDNLLFQAVANIYDHKN